MFTSLVFTRIPPLNFPIQISKISIFLLFILIVLRNAFQKNNNINGEIKITLIYFFIRSFSVINTVEIVPFVLSFQTFITGYLGFFIGLMLCNEKYRNKIINVYFFAFVLSTCINIGLELLFLSGNNAYLPFIKENFAQLIQANIERGRPYISFFNELSVPILLYWIIQKRNYAPIYPNLRKAFPYILLVTLIILALLSNWRIRIVLYIFCFFSLFLLIKKIDIGKTIRVFLFIFIIGVSVFILYPYASNIQYVSGRFFSDINIPEAISDPTNLLTSRSVLIKKALDVGLAYPITGVGFDHFYNFFHKSRAIAIHNDSLSNEVFHSPHNLLLTNFVESGFPGLILISLLLFIYMSDDYKSLKNFKEYDLKVVLIVQFWGIVIYSMVHPTDSKEFLYLFFFIRGLLASYKLSYEKTK